MLRSTYAFYNAVHHAEIVPIMPAFRQPVGVGDTHLIPHMIGQGEQATLEALPYLRQLGLAADGGTVA